MYIREAHPTDGRQTQANVREGILVEDPRTKAEREEVAHEFAGQFKVSLPILIDGIDNKVGTDYTAMPDRIYVIDAEGKVAYKGGPGPGGFRVVEVPPVLDRLLNVRLADKAGIAGRPGGVRRPGARRRPDPLRAVLDRNNDGEIDADELAGAVASLRRLDKNKDGKLSADEIRPNFPRRGIGGRVSAEVIAERLMSRDKDKDGQLDREELAEQAPRYLRLADANKDGKLDKEEIKALAKRFSRGGRGRPGSPRP
jgi:Ca2+-binding EF-hand superfamily protein